MSLVYCRCGSALVEDMEGIPTCGELACATVLQTGEEIRDLLWTEMRLIGKTTLSGKAPTRIDGGAPGPIDPKTGMHTDYWVLSSEERSKGFIRPVRRTYRHVGRSPKYPLRDLTPEEKELHGDSFVKFEEYPSGSSVIGRFWEAEELKPRCGTTTTMGIAIAETYARDPKFYGRTFCVTCGAHFPVGENGEFVWDGTDEKVGT